MATDTDPVLAIAGALTLPQCQTIMFRFTTANPHWRGATVADILDALDDSDSDLDQTEPFFEATEAENWPLGAGVAARALIWSNQDLTTENMHALLTAAGLND